MLPWIALLLFVPLVTVALAARSLAPWVPIWRKDVDRVIRLAALKPGEIFYDLGSGDGRLVFAAAKMPGVKAIGIELALPLLLFAKLQGFFHRSRARFRWGDLFRTSLQNAHVIYVFGMPAALADRFKTKIEEECSPGTRIISYVFPIQGWTPNTIDRPTEKDNELYHYILL